MQRKSLSYVLRLPFTLAAIQELKDEGLLNLPIYCSGHSGKSITVDNSIDMDEAIKRNLGTNPVVKEVVGFHDNLVYSETRTLCFIRTIFDHICSFTLIMLL